MTNPTHDGSPKRNPQENTVKCFVAKAFSAFKKFFKKFENMDCKTGRFSLTEMNAHGALPAYKQIYDEKQKLTKQTIIDIFLKNNTSSRVLPEVVQKKLRIIYYKSQNFLKFSKIIKKL